MSKFRSFTHWVGAAIVSVGGSVAYYLSTHPADLAAINAILSHHPYSTLTMFLLSQLLLLYHNPTNGGATK